MLTKKDYIKIANIIKNFKYREEEHNLPFNPIKFLIDEFCYWLEDDNPNFNEVKFRNYINK